MVLPIMFYGSQIRSPCTQVDFKRLETVQHKILRFISRKLGRKMSTIKHDYTDIVTRCNIPSIKAHHLLFDCMFTYQFKKKNASLRGDSESVH